MIHRAKFQNFKALRDVEVTFDSRLTVLVGPNGSGKTSVLQGMHALSQIALLSGDDPNGPLANFTEYLSLGARGGPLSASIEGARPTLSNYRSTINFAQSNSLTAELSTLVGRTPTQRWRVTLSGDATFWFRSSENSGGQWHDKSYTTRRLQPDEVKQFDATAFIRFSAGQLAIPTLQRTKLPQIAKDGLGLATTLSHIRLSAPKQFDAIMDAFRRVIPSVMGVRFENERVSGSDIYGASLLLDYKGVEGVKASHVSSGTLFALGLLTVALGPDSANVILLDDLDHGLHPKAQMELIAVFRNLIEQNPDLQIIATAHSPYILQRLEWNEVRVTELRDDGSAICARLEDHPEVERWREAMTPGEFWSHIGDEWVKKLGKPQTEQPQPEPVAS